MKTRAKNTHSLRHFRDASLSVLESLQQRFGMALWMVNRGDEDSIVLQVRDSGIDPDDADVKSALQFYCRVAALTGPKIEPNVDDATTLAGTSITRRMNVGAYIGLPLMTDEGTLVGTMCAIDPERQPESLRKELPVFEAIASLLADMLLVESQHDQLMRRLERAEARLVDSVTGLYNRQGWERLVQAEELRCDRYNRPAGAVIFRIEDESAGEQVLSTAGELISQKTRETDVAARIDDDTFGLLVLETETQALSKVAARLDNELSMRGIAAAAGFAMRDPKTGFAGAIRAAEPQPVH